MEVTCPGCRKKLKVPESLMGKKVKCPACKGIVEVEESLEVVMDDLPTYSSGRHEPAFPDFPAPPVAPQAKAGSGRMPAAPVAPPARAGSGRTSAAPGPDPATPSPGKPGVCQTCGFPVLPGVEHCNRCGTVLATGEQRADKVGYQASVFTRLGKKTYWIGSAVAIFVIITILGVMAIRARRWAESFDEKDGKEPVAEQSKPAATPAAASTSSTAAARTDEPAAPAPTPAANAAELEKIRAAIEAAFPEALDERPLVSAEAMRKITALGPNALPILKDLRNRHDADPIALDRIVQIAGRLQAPEAMHFVADFVRHDSPALKRLAAETLVQARATAGSAVAGLLNDPSPAVRRIGAQTAGKMQVASHNPILAELVRKDEDPGVRHRAAVALGSRVGVDDAKLALIGTLEDPVYDVAAAAAESLAKSFPGSDELVSAMALLPVDPVTLASPKTFLLCRPIATNPRRPDSAQKLVTWLCTGLSADDAALIAEVLDVRNPSRRVQGLEKASGHGAKPATLVFACLLSMDDPNQIVSTAATVAVEQMASPYSGAGLVTMLASSSSIRSLEAAEILARMDDPRTKSLLEEVSKGFDPQRRMLAAGVLARQGSPRSSDEIVAALRETTGEVADGILGWTAYAFASAGAGDRNLLLAAGKEHAPKRPQPIDETFMQAAAIRLGDRGLSQPLVDSLQRLQGYHVLLAARLLGDLEEPAAVDPLKALLERDDPMLLREALRSLRKVTDAALINDLLAMMPRLRPHTAKVVREGIIAYGPEAESILSEQLLGEVRVAQVALHLLSIMGESVSSKTAVRLVEILREPATQHEIKSRLPEVLTAITGRGEAGWGWEEWAAELKVTLKDISDTTPFVRRNIEWISLELPAYWSQHGKSATGNALGRPELRMNFFYDQPNVRRYRTSKDMRSALAAQNHMEPQGNKVVAKSGIEVKALNVINTQGRPAGSVAILRVDNSNSKRTTIEFYVLSSLKAGNRYAVIELSVQSDQFALYEKMFVDRIAGSIQCLE